MNKDQKYLNKMMKKLARGINKKLWFKLFAPEFYGPNQGACCEDCLLYKEFGCRDEVPPELCIENQTTHFIFSHLMEKAEEEGDI
ncbi:MAG: hypothetical protein G3M78_08210 [Candidatus Nitrohelix vancouverensis]|uniref:Uncharacterized protein n=1 Tax=Candidatus Nitrohelix vancouverensis TaxID=2705534 RepID=A0A7T0G3H8_9BACT|nr:MAG: hypothetical protein G3M78_08210 [Candidatus Nitrohelix vancouverensis]